MPNEPILFRVENLSKTFSSRASARPGHAEPPALHNVTFDIRRGECLALIGESGGGKSTLGKCLIRLLQPSRGRVIYDETDLLQLPEKQFRRYRPKFQMIFQNPFQAFNPRRSVKACLVEALKFHRQSGGKLPVEMAVELLHRVGLPTDLLTRYPHELSGGQLQRVALARALTTKPELLVLDEPTSSLDAQSKHHIIELLRRLQRECNLTLLFISHDQSVVKAIADRVAVIYRGELVEVSPAEHFFSAALHPYAHTLTRTVKPAQSIDATPAHLETDRNRTHHMNRCTFATCCPVAREGCFEKKPALVPVGNSRHVACHLLDEVVTVATNRDITVTAGEV